MLSQVNRPTMPAGPDSEIRYHMDSLAAIVLEAPTFAMQGMGYTP